jgi:hypothetical protein
MLRAAPDRNLATSAQSQFRILNAQCIHFA